MKIGELARSVGVGIDTVRYYEREGLLPPARRLASGYRTYAAEDMQRIRFVRRAKALGFTLPEIRDLLSLSGHTGKDMAELQALARQKLADIDARIDELRRMRLALDAVVQACPGHGQIVSCPIHQALAGDHA
jgi:MerR family transcriptional regulator, copper efflux regulator